jgi:hypothetical protein
VASGDHAGLSQLIQSADSEGNRRCLISRVITRFIRHRRLPEAEGYLELLPSDEARDNAIRLGYLNSLKGHDLGDLELLERIVDPTRKTETLRRASRIYMSNTGRVHPWFEHMIKQQS